MCAVAACLHTLQAASVPQADTQVSMFAAKIFMLPPLSLFCEATESFDFGQVKLQNPKLVNGILSSL